MWQDEVRDLPLEALFLRGGDDRLAIDPASGRNRYLVSGRPWPGIVLSSCTASPPSPAGAAAAEAWRTALTPEFAACGEAALAQAEAALAQDIAAFFATPGTQVTLAPSGTDATLLAMGRIAAAAPGPLASILPGLEETGTGVPLAAAGRHFAPLAAGGAPVPKGETVPGFPPSLPVHPIKLRDVGGDPRDPAAIETECDAAIAAYPGRVVLHALEGSKTGLTAPGLAAADRLRARHGARLTILVDACQARCPPARLRAWLDRGCPVLVTGSKLLGGPPFAGAVLWPAAWPDAALPEGLAAYCPDPVGRAGMMARWVAALAAAAPWRALTAAERDAALATLAGAVAAGIARDPRLAAVEPGGPDGGGIFTIAMRGRHGDWLGAAALRSVQLALADRLLLGQPVALGAGGRAALRLAVSAAQIADPAGTAETIARAFALWRAV